MSLIARSDADLAIFGGDLNAGPIDSPRHPYGMLRTVMQVSILTPCPSICANLSQTHLLT